MVKKNVSYHDEKFQEGTIVESWSKWRIIAAAVLLIGAGALGYWGFTKLQHKAAQVLGAQSGPRISSGDVSLPSSTDAQKMLNQAKQELNNLTSDNLTSSQGALQQVITELQALQKGKENPTDLICKQLCGK